MNENEIKVMLDQIAEYQSAIDVCNLNRQAAIDAVLTDEIRAKLAEIDAEFAPSLEFAAERKAALEAEVKPAVIAHGATVKGAHLQAVYAKGRVSWATDKLEGLMIAIPQLAALRKVGEPSVSFRKV
jgi:hypothetical protein